VPPLPPLEPELDALNQRNRNRSLTLLDGASRTHPTRAGAVVRSFASNDYLGLSNHPELLRAATEAARRHGFGAGASRLVTGHLPPHAELEQSLAELVNLPAALLFPTGYQANLGVLTSLAGPADLIASDQLNHASIIDGCRLSRARLAVYPHLDSDAAQSALATAGSFRRRFLVTESLFSMDGDRAPLFDLSTIARAAGATLIVDEAHALGVLGPSGRGLCRANGVTPDILVGTLGKAFGSFGGFAAGPAILRDYLVNRARPFIYTTATPPPVAAAALAGVRLSMTPEGDARRSRLFQSIACLRAALATTPYRNLPEPGPIVPITIGSDQTVLALSRRLAEAGLFVPAIRPPTVPEGTARLRITLSANHQPDDLTALTTALLAALGPVRPLE
jgi:8-amino-7-oxononanoate synthase